MKNAGQEENGNAGMYGGRCRGYWVLLVRGLPGRSAAVHDFSALFALIQSVRGKRMRSNCDITRARKGWRVHKPTQPSFDWCGADASSSVSGVAGLEDELC